MTDTDLKALSEAADTIDWDAAIEIAADYIAVAFGRTDRKIPKHRIPPEKGDHDLYLISALREGKRLSESAGTLIPVSEVEARVKAEREAIAKEIEDWQLFTKHSQENVTMELATAIRARGDSQAAALIGED